MERVTIAVVEPTSAQGAGTTESRLAAATIDAGRGANLFAVIRGRGLALETPCAGKGTCGKCKVRVLRGLVSPPTPEEERFLPADDLAKGIRLACRTWVDGDVEVEILGARGPSIHGGSTDEGGADEGGTDGGHRILEAARQPKVRLGPGISKLRFDLPPASFQEAVPAIDRLARALPFPVARASRLTLLQNLGQLEASGRAGTAVLAAGRIIGLEPGDTTRQCYGLAIDIGTTTVVASLVDLLTGKEIATSSDLNPQKAFGLDVLSRIEYAQSGPGELGRLRDDILNCLNTLVTEACRKAAVGRDSIYQACVAGNSTMMHLLLGVNPRSIGTAPYSPVFTGEEELAARDVGLSISPFGRVYCLPSVSGYVGADITAGILATRMNREKGTALLIDIGTNGEIALTSGGKLVACASPAGPALEGMNISRGMRAAVGAVEEIVINPDGIRFKTIGQQPPVGICGSGIIDMVAELLKVGVIEPSGRLISKQKLIESGQHFLAERLTERGTKRDFLLISSDQAPPDGLFATQQDIRQVQLAKGAITAGITALLEEAGLSEEAVDKVYIAGAFGTHVRLESLIRIGIIPAAWADRVTFVGNSAKAGALMCLLAQSKRREAGEISRTTRYFELSVRPGFDRLFSQSLKFPAGV